MHGQFINLFYEKKSGVCQVNEETNFIKSANLFHLEGRPPYLLKNERTIPRWIHVTNEPEFAVYSCPPITGSDVSTL